VGEEREEYLVTIHGASGSAELSTDSPSVTISAADISNLGSGPAVIQVRQIGDWGASRPLESTIIL
jgi:hypothetical protein